MINPFLTYKGSSEETKINPGFNDSYPLLDSYHYPSKTSTETDNEIPKEQKTEDVNSPSLVRPTIKPISNNLVSARTLLGGNKESFIKMFSPYAERIAENTGLDKRFIIAKAGLETGWGKSVHDYNFGNLTTGSNWKGAFVDRGDKNAKGESIKNRFRKYNSWDESVEDYSNFMKSKRYSGLSGLSAEDAADMIQSTGYAEDLNYGKKLREILKTL